MQFYDMWQTVSNFKGYQLIPHCETGTNPVRYEAERLSLNAFPRVGHADLNITHLQTCTAIILLISPKRERLLSVT
jgi:hypothetical protein